MKKTILAVFGASKASEEADFYANHIREMHDCNVISAVLTPEQATDAHPFIDNVLDDCLRNGTHLDGVLVHDPSVPSDHPGLQFLHQIHQDATARLATVEADVDASMPRITLENAADPVAGSNRLAELEKGLARIAAEAKDKERERLTERKQIAEDFLLSCPPSDRGVNLIQLLRNEHSPYKDVVIVAGAVNSRHPHVFEEAGADAVHHGLSEDYVGEKHLFELIDERRKQPAKPGATELKAGPRNPTDHGGRPRGNGPDTPDF